jgi:hypothetical protein
VFEKIIKIDEDELFRNIMAQGGQVSHDEVEQFLEEKKNEAA